MALDDQYGSIVMRKYSCKVASVVCELFTISNIFENEKGITKILIYSSTIKINQINVFFFAMIITSGWEQFA